MITAVFEKTLTSWRLYIEYLPDVQNRLMDIPICMIYEIQSGIITTINMLNKSQLDFFSIKLKYK